MNKVRASFTRGAMRLFCLFILLSVSRFSENIIKRKHLPNACTYVIEKNDQNQIIKREIRNEDDLIIYLENAIYRGSYTLK